MLLDNTATTYSFEKRPELLLVLMLVVGEDDGGGGGDGDANDEDVDAPSHPTSWVDATKAVARSVPKRCANLSLPKM